MNDQPTPGQVLYELEYEGDWASMPKADQAFHEEVAAEFTSHILAPINEALDAANAPDIEHGPRHETSRPLTPAERIAALVASSKKDFDTERCLTRELGHRLNVSEQALAKAKAELEEAHAALADYHNRIRICGDLPETTPDEVANLKALVWVGLDGVMPRREAVATGTITASVEWIVERAAYAEGKTIQSRPNGLSAWTDCTSPQWFPYNEYRIKPEEPTDQWAKEKEAEKEGKRIEVRYFVGGWTIWFYKPITDPWNEGSVEYRIAPDSIPLGHKVDRSAEVAAMQERFGPDSTAQGTLLGAMTLDLNTGELSEASPMATLEQDPAYRDLVPGDTWQEGDELWIPNDNEWMKIQYYPVPYHTDCGKGRRPIRPREVLTHEEQLECANLAIDLAQEELGRRIANLEER